MAKIEEKITYNGQICKFVKTIDKLSFYSYGKNEEDDVLLIVDKDKNVLARICACMSCGAYGDYFNGFVINNE